MTTPSNTGYEIVRGIGRWDLVALMVNITIGSGILGLPAKLFALTGVYSVLALVLCAVLLAIVAICFAEVGSRFTNTGGPYLFTRTAFGATAGFIVGWLYWVSRVLTFATICNLLVVYVARVAPALQGPGARIAIVSLVVLGILLVNLLGIRQATVVSNGLTLLKVSLLLVFGVVGILAVNSWPSAPAALPAAADFSDAMLLGVFAFVGFEAALVSAGETRNPRRDVPFAVAMSLLIVLVLYAGVQIVCIAAVPELAKSTAPFADAAVVLWGPVGETVIALGAIVIMLGSLNSGFLATSRLPFAFAEQGDVPAVLARVHPRFRTPHVAIFASAALVWLATVASSFLSAITLATSTRMVVYIAGCIALIALRRRSDVAPPGFVAPLGVAIAVIASILSFALLASASSRELMQLAVATVIGVVILAAMRALPKRQ
ncbi:MAG TPA: amino acid permease [Steroidobacteraceae bacterium]|jgi:amino acid transporter